MGFNPFTWLGDQLEDAWGFVWDDVVGGMMDYVVDTLVPETPEQVNRGTEITKEGTNHPIPVIYGERRVGPILIHKEVRSTVNNSFLWMVGILCEGAVEAVGLTADDIYIDDVPLSDARFTGKYALWLDEVNDLGESSTIDMDVVIQRYTGVPAGTLAFDYNVLLASISDDWSSTDTMNGLCYFVARFTYNPDLFRGEPNIKIVVRGKKCFDPRDSSTAYTQNPALHLYDYWSNSVYGKGLSDLNDTEFQAAATKCDTLIANYAGGSQEAIFTSNMAISPATSVLENTKLLLRAMRGIYTHQGGEYGVRIEDEETPVITLNENHLINNKFSIAGESKSNRYNRVIAEFVNPDMNWQDDEVPWPDNGSAIETQFLAEDNSEVLETRIQLPACTNKYQARELARIVCLVSRHSKTFVAEFTAEAMICVSGDLVVLDVFSQGEGKYRGRVTTTAGATITRGSVNDAATIQNNNGAISDLPAGIVRARVVKVSITPSGSIALTMREHQPFIYPWLSDSEIPTFTTPPYVDPYAGIDDVAGLAAVENLDPSTDGTSQSFIDLSWTASTNSYVDKHEVRVKKQGETDYIYYEAREDSILIAGLRVGTIYECGVRHKVETRNIKGDWSADVAITLLGDVTAPAEGSSITVTGGPFSILVEWTNPADWDLAATEIHIRTDATEPVNDTHLEETLKSTPSKVQSFRIALGDFDLDTTYYISMAWLDATGNQSTWSTPASAKFLRARTTELNVAAGRVAFDQMQLLVEHDLNSHGDRQAMFDPTGLLMFQLDKDDGYVRRWILTTAFDVSTATYDTGHSVNTDGTTHEGLRFSPDGLKMYVGDSGNDRIRQWTLTSAWDFTFDTYDGYFDTGGEVGHFEGFALSATGSKLFAMSNTTSNRKIHEYTVSTAGDLTGTVTPTGDVLDFDADLHLTSGNLSFDFADGGNTVLIYQSTADYLYGYDLFNITAFDFSLIGTVYKSQVKNRSDMSGGSIGGFMTFDMNTHIALFGDVLTGDELSVWSLEQLIGKKTLD